MVSTHDRIVEFLTIAKKIHDRLGCDSVADILDDWRAVTGLNPTHTEMQKAFETFCEPQEDARMEKHMERYRFQRLSDYLAPRLEAFSADAKGDSTPIWLQNVLKAYKKEWDAQTVPGSIEHSAWVAGDKTVDTSIFRCAADHKAPEFKIPGI